MKPGTQNDHAICLNDLMATAAEIVGAKVPANAGEDSVSLLPEFLATSQDGVRESTIHQSFSGDLSIRKGPWKKIFFTSGKRELYKISDDLSEKKDMLAENPEISSALTALMQTCIDQGRSTLGEPQKNDYALSITKRSETTKHSK